MANRSANSRLLSSLAAKTKIDRGRGDDFERSRDTQRRNSPTKVVVFPDRVPPSIQIGMIDIVFSRLYLLR
jgi:hypothetical protein